MYYGIYEPDQLLPLPRYRCSAVEERKADGINHVIRLNLKRLADPAVDVAELKKNDGGVIVYRLEIYNPRWATSFYYDRRFEFQGDELLPTVVAGPFVDQITDTSVVISWETDRPAHGTVFIDKKAYEIEPGAPAVHFEKRIAGLKPGSVHTYMVKISDDRHTTMTREYFFTTPESDATSFSFAVMGDSREGYGGGENAFGGVNYKVTQRFAMDAFNRGVEFIIHTGDMVNGYTTGRADLEMQLTTFKSAVEPVGHFIPIYEVMGNHEVVIDIYDDGSRSGLRFDKRGDESSEVIFARHFVNPTNGPEPDQAGAPPYRENVYYFDYGNSRFVIMNNNYWWSGYPEEYGGNLEGYVLDDQFKWLKRVFADAAVDSTVEHLFLFAQEPMFPTGGHARDGMWYHGGDPEMNNGIDRSYIVRRRDEIWRAFIETGKAVAGSFGDEHNYSRTLITSGTDPGVNSPVWQIISGGAGAPFYAQDKSVPWAPFVLAFSTQMNYVLIRVEGSRVELEAYGFTGEMIDEAVLKE
ncbi:MAG TPA: hypothetical protein ENL08_03725 [Bacteroidetes bacterium]|nr:hypothetical protein [Bacteroidota bacterium]